MSQSLRWGVLGTASIAKRSVIPGIRGSKRNEVVAIASRNQETAERTAAELHIESAYGDYESLINSSEIDAVYIPLPNHLHLEWTLRATEAGKHVLCEKPIALTSAEAEKMVEACQKAGVHLAEAFMYRHHPRYQMIKDVLKSGEIGELRGIQANFTFNSANNTENIRYNKDWGGGSLYDVGCYPISVARLLTGLEPEAVTAQAMFSEKHGGVDMMTSGFVEFPNSVSLIFDCGMWAAYRNHMEVLGTDGVIKVPSAFVSGGDVDSSFYIEGKLGNRKVEVPEVNQYSCMADDFAAVVLDGQNPKFAPQDAIQNMKVLESALRSAEQRVRIEL